MMPTAQSLQAPIASDAPPTAGVRDLRHRADAPMGAAIRAIPAAWFKPDPLVYWTDMLLSAATGWTAFVLAVVSTSQWRRAGLLILAAFALYRAVLFIHELTHLASHELPSFRTAWNA